jgi:hypothetical protein
VETTVNLQTSPTFVEVKQARTSEVDLKDNRLNSVVATEPLEKT